MIFNLTAIGDFLGERLTANAEELTDEQLQKMSKDDLISAVKELRLKHRTLARKNRQINDKIMELFLSIKS
jgi:hypothetical protein